MLSLPKRDRILLSKDGSQLSKLYALTVQLQNFPYRE